LRFLSIVIVGSMPRDIPDERLAVADAPPDAGGINARGPEIGS
jgi:hypothetical protein